MGLATPVEQYNGMFKYGDVRNSDILKSNKSLELLANYIIYHEQIAEQYDTNTLLEDLDKGLYFDSNIPQGYGLGSSGALAAAVYFQYNKFKKKGTQLTQLKNELALLENYYHGKSSGLDATVCYLNKAVLLSHAEITDTFDLSFPTNTALKIFLINTHIPRSTSQYVNLFLEKCKQIKFMDAIENSLVPATNVAIESFIEKKYQPLMSSIKLISQMQYDLLPEFIPHQFKQLWRLGLQQNDFHLKVCGAGGGGFIIGFAKADADLDILLGATDVVEVMKI